MIKTSVLNADEIHGILKDEMESFIGDSKMVLVGIHEGEGDAPDGEITMAHLGAVHEFGATINHPGGTDYGYQTKEDAEKGRVKFMKKGTGYMKLGTTGPHVIDIPARPWLVPGVENGEKEYLDLMEDGVADGLDTDTILGQVGVMAVAAAQKKIVDVRTPPNARSTIKKKGSSNPLVDTGAMRQSVTHSLTSNIEEEGIS